MARRLRIGLIGADRPASPDLFEAARIGRVLDAVLESARQRAWVRVEV